jgi:ATP-dependent Lhr-like helicase
MRMYVRETSPHHGSTVTDLLYPDLIRAVALTRLMLQKWLEPSDVDRMHLSTLIHQILSCLKQTGGTSAAKLYSTLVEQGPFRKINVDLFKSVLKGLGEKNLIEQCAEGELILAGMGEKITSSYDFYSAFVTSDELTIRNGEESIGSLPANLIPPVGEHLILAGRRWLVEEIDLVSKVVFVAAAKGGKAPMFLSASGDLHTNVTQEMRAVLLEADEPIWLHPDGKLLLRAARNTAIASGIAKTNLMVMRKEIRWFPWVGTRTFETFRAFARKAGIKHEVDWHRLSIAYQLESADDLASHLSQIANSNLSSTELAESMPIKSIEKYDGFLSNELLDMANGHDRLNCVEAKKVATEMLDSMKRY